MAKRTRRSRRRRNGRAWAIERAPQEYAPLAPRAASIGVFLAGFTAALMAVLAALWVVVPAHGLGKGLLMGVVACLAPLLLIWFAAVVSRRVTLHEGRFSYHVPGKFGGAMFTPGGPLRHCLTLERSHLVWSTWGPRLIPRYVVPKRQHVLTELFVVRGAVTVIAPHRLESHASRALEPPAPKQQCSECGRVVFKRVAVTCEACSDIMHRRYCELRHRARHEGDGKGGPYR